MANLVLGGYQFPVPLVFVVLGGLLISVGFGGYQFPVPIVFVILGSHLIPVVLVVAVFPF